VTSFGNGLTFGLSQRHEFKLLWVLDFPLFEYDEEGNRWVARPSSFTSPKPSDIQTMINNNPALKMLQNTWNIRMPTSKQMLMIWY
jgi:aspartyl-tRNA synthetase